MKKILVSLSLVAILSSCTDTKNKHMFHYVITGNSAKATELYGRMGPGIEFSSPKVDIPFEVTHEVYGTELEYELRIANSDTTNNKYSVKVYIDDKLINSNGTYTGNVVGVKGTFIQ